MWLRASLQLPSQLTAVTSALTQGADLAGRALAAGTTFTQGGFDALRDLTDTRAATLDAALDVGLRAIREGLAALLDTTGAYVLMVPPPRRGIARLLTPRDVPPTPGAVLYPPGAAARAGATFLRTFDATDLFSGGNSHVVRTIAASLTDPGDRNRPAFDAASAWAYGLFVAGGTDLTSALASASFLDRLFRASTPTGGTTAGVTSLVPSGVRVQPSGRGFFPVVTWNAVPASTVARAFDDTRVVASRWALIRTKDVRARTARRVEDLFGTTALREGLTGNYEATVVVLRDYDGVIDRWVDATVPDTPGVTYYYHVAFQTRLEHGRTRRDLPWDLLTTGTPFTVPTRARPAPSTGTPPDWIRTPGLASLAPGLDRVLDRVTEALRAATSSARHLSSQPRAATALLAEQLATRSRQLQEINLFLQQLTSVYATPDHGVYVGLNYGTGDVGAFLDAVTSSFDEADPNAPPFHTGDEYTVAVLALAVGPDASLVRRTYDLLQLLFAPAALNVTAPTLDAVPGLPEALGVTPTTPAVTFDETMTPTPGLPDAAC